MEFCGGRTCAIKVPFKIRDPQLVVTEWIEHCKFCAMRIKDFSCVDTIGYRKAIAHATEDELDKVIRADPSFIFSGAALKAVYRGGVLYTPACRRYFACVKKYHNEYPSESIECVSSMAEIACTENSNPWTKFEEMGRLSFFIE